MSDPQEPYIMENPPPEEMDGWEEEEEFCDPYNQE
jgi:hypothetical protein